jgi:predicted RNase H-like HicB family nuclease
MRPRRGTALSREPSGVGRLGGRDPAMIRGMTQMQLTAVYMKVPEGYVAFVEELPGANTQGATMAEARANLNEAVAMVMEANRELAEESLSGTEVIRERLVLPVA